MKNPDQKDFNDDGRGDACEDSDDDRSTDQLELYVGTNPNQRCAATTARKDEPVGATPWDIDNNRVVNGQDLGMFAPHFGVTSADPRYSRRFDLNMDGKVNGQDLGKLAPYFGKTCVYP